jgi:hypothetical protein
MGSRTAHFDSRPLPVLWTIEVGLMQRRFVGAARMTGVALGVTMGVLLVGQTSVLPAPDAPDGMEKRGCCSHHHGVCGCQGQQAMCCDGTPSPSCGC